MREDGFHLFPTWGNSTQQINVSNTFVSSSGVLKNGRPDVVMILSLTTNAF